MRHYNKIREVVDQLAKRESVGQSTDNKRKPSSSTARDILNTGWGAAALMIVVLVAGCDNGESATSVRPAPTTTAPTSTPSTTSTTVASSTSTSPVFDGEAATGPLAGLSWPGGRVPVCVTRSVLDLAGVEGGDLSVDGLDNAAIVRPDDLLGHTTA